MNRIWMSFALVLVLGASAPAQSMGTLMQEADLVVMGELEKESENGRAEIFSMQGLRIIKGAIEPGFFKIVRFKDLGCQKPLHEGERALLFLRRLQGKVSGLTLSCPAYVVFAPELGKVNYSKDQESAIREGAERYAALCNLTGEERASHVVDLFRSALEGSFEPLLYSTAYDVVSMPGALALLSARDADKLKVRFFSSPAMSPLRRRLLYLLGDLSMPGTTEIMESVVRSEEGMYYREALGAILAARMDPDTPKRLVYKARELGPVERDNVLYVLGWLGKGRGIPALRSILWENLEHHYEAITHALSRDRSDAALEALAQIAASRHRDGAIKALEALAQINNPAARLQLQSLASSQKVRKSIRERAFDLISRLSAK